MDNLLKAKLLFIVQITFILSLSCSAPNIFSIPKQYNHVLALDCDGTYPVSPLTDLTGSYKYALIAYDGVNVYEAPYKNSRSTKHNFKQLVYIYKENKDLALIGKSDNGKYLLGWIENRHLLMDKKPLEHMHVFKKLLPMNSFEEGNLSQRVPFRAGPGSNYGEVYGSAIFSIWYVYREENGYALVGKGQTWNAETMSNKDTPWIAGWVDKKSCYEWNTLVALNFKKENVHEREKAKFFKSAKAAQSYYNTKKYNNDDVIKEESSVPLKYWEMRFPILGYERHGEQSYFFVAIPQAHQINNKITVGWVSLRDRNGKYLFEPELLTEKNVLSIFKGVLMSVLVFPDKSPKALPIALSMAVEIVTGQKINERQNIHDYFTTVLGIDLQDSLLNKTEAELTELCSTNPDQCIKLLDKIKRSKIYLDSVEGRYELEETRDGKLAIVYEDMERKQKKEKEYWWKTEAGEEFTWIPLSYLL